MIQAFEGLRGFAALFVIFFHGWDGFIYRISLIRNAWLMVDLFFVLSGSVMAFAYANRITDLRSTIDFAVRRLGRLYPLHIVTAVGFVLLAFCVRLAKQIWVGRVDLAAALHAAGSVDVSTAIAQATLTHSLGTLPGLTWNAPSWSISTEFWTYLVFGLTVFLCGRRRLAIAALTLASGAIWYLVAVVATPHLNVHYDYGFARCVYGFFLGVLVTLLVRAVCLTSWSSFACSALQLVTSLAAFFAVTYAHLLPKATLAIPLIFAGLVFSLASDRGIVARMLSKPSMQYLGMISYSLYMCHYVVLPYFKGFALSIPSQWADFVYIPYMICVLLLAHAAHRYIEVPGREYGYRMSMRLMTRPVASA